MARRTNQSPENQIQAYVNHLNNVLNKTVTDSRLTRLEVNEPNLWHITRYQSGNIAPLELKPRGALWFSQNVGVRIINDERQIVVDESAYSFYREGGEENEDSWVFRYEYNRTPDADDGRPHSHVHFNGVHPKFSDLDYKRLHIPVGRVSIERTIAHLIMEHGITPKNGKDAAMEFLSESHKEFAHLWPDIDDEPFP